MRLKRFGRSTFGLVTAALISLPFFGAVHAQDRGGIARLVAAADGSSIGYPPTMRRTNDFLPALSAVETLLRYGDDGLPEAFLATGWEEDPEGLTITLTLREGVTFHDGTPFDAEAAKWNLEQFMASDRPDLKAVESVEVTGTHTVVLNLVRYDNTIIGSLAGTPGLMVSPSAFEANGSSVEWAEVNPVGTGPFTLVSWEKDVKQVYERYEGYWQEGKPYLDGLEWVFIPDTVTQFSALKTGEVHSLTEVSPGDAIPFMDDDAWAINRARIGVGGFGILFDSTEEDSPFHDVRVRQAAIHAVDTVRIVERLTRGLFEHTNQLVDPGHWGYNPDVTGYPYDPEKARELLAEAGYPDGFKTVLTTWNSPALTVDAFTAVQAFLKEVGIDAELQLVDRGQLVKIVVGGEWDGMMWASPGAPNPDPARAFIADLSDSSPLWKLVKHPEGYEAALAEATVATSFEAKQANVWDAQKIFFDDEALMLPLWSRSDLSVKTSRLHDEGLFALNRTQWNPADAWLEAE